MWEFHIIRIYYNLKSPYRKLYKIYYFRICLQNTRVQGRLGARIEKYKNSTKIQNIKFETYCRNKIKI